MSDPAHPLSDYLRRLRGELDLAVAGDAPTIARARASLEWLAGSLPPQRADARRLIGLAAEATHSLDGPIADAAGAARLLQAIRGAASAAAEHLAKPNDFGCELLVIQAGQGLLSAMGREAAEWLRAAPAPAAAPPAAPLSLDDAASLLMMIEPREREEIARIRATVALLTAEHGVPPLARVQAAEADAALGRALDAPPESAEAARALTEATDYLDRAIRSRQEAHDVAALAIRVVSAVPAAADERGAVDQELVRDFLVECRDYLESAEGALLQLEADRGDMEAINTVFRAFHTVKGTSAFLQLDDVTEFAHEAESVFSRVRDRELEFSGPIPDLALRAVDMLSALLAAVEAAGARDVKRPPGYAEVLAALSRVAGGDDTVAPRPAVATDEGQAAVDAMFGELMAEVKGITMPTPAEARAARRSSAESSIRVRTDRLDRLIDMVGELVIAQTMVAQDVSVQAAGHHGLSRKVTDAGKIVRELHDLSLSMRMVPLRPTFQKLTRLVRDLAQGMGKPVEFTTTGEETEIDRNMVDALSDPLVHMVRNAIDHGIESPADRAAAGKPRQGTVRLTAAHAGGTVVVELTDDGRGLDRDRILAKAVGMGLVDASAKLSDAEVFELIFAPGFSTADKITGVSGRGVGMDVVRRNIESLRGRVGITSVPGRGATFTVQLPLTLAVTDGMLVRVGAERYVIPMTSIFMSFRPERDALMTIAGRGEMVTLREEVLPMFRLHRLFNVAGATADPCAALLIVVAVGDQRVALLVDELLGQQQVVAKSLGDGLGKIQGISGGAILGDGRVGLILDAGELITLLRRHDDEGERVRAVA